MTLAEDVALVGVLAVVLVAGAVWSFGCQEWELVPYLLLRPRPIE